MNFPLKDGTDWTLTPELYSLFDEHYPHIDIDVELKKMHTWLTFNDNRRKTARGMKKAINHWLSNDSIPKAKRMQAPNNKIAQYEARMGTWLRTATLETIENNESFKTLLSDPDMRAWAENVQPLVKEVK